MKNLTKIFMAVVAGMFAFSCATDTTEDLGVQVGGGEGLTSITLSLEESRTQLGEKNPTTKLYPLYWSDGDQISVNGVAYTAQISTTNPAVATFAVAEAEKYEVVYPVTDAGVLFAEKQNHVVEGDTFESGVSTMYGTGVAGEPIALHHLTGVLKFAVTGDAVLSKIQISTIDRAPIAGPFDINFETGELTATKASKKVIEYSFGENGLQLTAEAQWMHVAVPAGQYDELYVTLYDNADGVMYATVKAGESKPLAAGGVREFNTPIVYAPNAQVFVINSAEQLVKFKADIEAEGGLAMDAVLTEDIDMTGVEWTPISGANYVNTIHGNGYAIKGLTAPLFWTTSASVKGLHFVNVDIETNVTSNKHGYYGVLAGTLTPAEGVTELRVENCSVSGKVYINNPNFAGDNHFWFGGMIGNAVGVNIDSCISDIEITASDKPTGEGKTKNFAIGGLVGMAAGSGEMYTTVTNSKNYGSLDLRPGGRINTLIVGGLISYSQNTNPGFIMKNCENSGSVTFVGAGTVKNAAYVGGIIGFVAECKNSNIANSTNSGALYIDKLTVTSATGTCYVAGCIPNIQKVVTDTESAPSITNLTNSGDVEVSVTTTVTTYIAGCVGLTGNASAPIFSNCYNTGNITMSGKTGGSLVIGGVLSALPAGTYTECVNSGNITISSVVGDATIEGYNTKATASVGGLFGETLDGTSTNITRCQNHGSIEFTKDAKVASSTYSGGILASHVAAVAVVVEDCWNSGNLTFNGTSSAVTASTFYVAGGIGHTVSTGGSFSMKGYLINSGNISVNGDTTKTKSYFAVGGVISRSILSFALAEGATEAKIVNTGSVSTTCSVSVAAYVGGAIACTSKAIAEGIEIVNIGDITVTGSFTAGTRNIGGAVGTVANNIVHTATSYCTVTAIDANGKADYSGTAGILMGSPYTAGKYEIAAGYLGGTIICESIEDPNSGTATEGPGELTADNYYQCIYGNEVSAEIAARYQLLEEAPVVTLPARLPAAN